jgi:hypothetical protein
MEVARVGVEDRGLTGERLNHAGMRVPHVADVVHHVEVGTPVGIVEERAEAAHDMERLLVGKTEVSGEPFAPLKSKALFVLPRRPSGFG